MALPWWLRGALTGGAALLKKRLKGKGEELVGEARKKAIAKLAKKQKNGMSRKELMKHGEKEAKREKTKKLRDSTQEEADAASKSLQRLPWKERPYPKADKGRREAASKRLKKAAQALSRRKSIEKEDVRMRRIRGGGHTRADHTITGKVKGDTELRDFSNSLLKQDIRIAKHVKGLQELKKMREMVKSGDLPKHVSKRLAREYGKHTRERVIYPKLAKPAKESFQRIQKKKDKDRFKKKDSKKKGKQDGAKPKMSQDIMEKIKKHHDIIVPISALGAGGALSYLKRKKKDAKKKGKQGD